MDQSVVYDIGLTALGMVVFLLVYTFPSFIAHTRDHKQFVRILVVNVLFGFLVLPWLIMLAYAALSSPKE